MYPQHNGDKPGPKNGNLAPSTIVHYPDHNAEKMFRNRQRRKSVVEFLCLSVRCKSPVRGNFPDMQSALGWVKEFRNHESTNLSARIKKGQSGSETSELRGTCILVVVDMVQSFSGKELTAELKQREALAGAGAILLERPEQPSTAMDDKTFVDAWLVAVRQQLVADRQQLQSTSSQPLVPPVVSFFDWQVTEPSTAGAEMFGRQIPHAPLPSSDRLTEMFQQSYLPDDCPAREDLDY
jgi:hypothetical protein